jgi:hypothetical protein
MNQSTKDDSQEEVVQDRYDGGRDLSISDSESDSDYDDCSLEASSDEEEEKQETAKQIISQMPISWSSSIKRSQENKDP